MEPRDLHWFDGKVLEEKLGDVVDRLQILITKSDQNSDAFAKIKTLKEKAHEVRSLGLTVTEGVLSKYDAACNSFSAKVPEEMSALWYRAVANIKSLVSSLTLAFTLGPKLKQVILLLDEVSMNSAELDIVADGLRKAYAEFWQHWFIDVNKLYQVPNARALFEKRHDLELYLDQLMQLPKQVSSGLVYAKESESPLILNGTKKFVERLAEIRLHEIKEDVFTLTDDFFGALNDFGNLGEEVKEIPVTVPSHGSLGRGAFGKVVVVEYEGQLAAKKLVNSDANGLCRYVLELTAWKAVSRENPSPFILKLVGSGIDPETQKFVFLSEIAKCTLESMLEDQVQKEPEYVKSVATDIARGLQHMHDLEYLHLDVKADNVFMFTDELSPSGYRAKLGDFGISRKAPVESAGGCLLYMPVEARLYGHFDYSNDIYAFGLVLYQLLEPKSFERCTIAGNEAFLNPVPFSWHTSSRARAVVRKCLGPYTRRPSAKTLVKKIPKLRLRKYMSSVIPAVPKLFKRDGEYSSEGSSSFFPPSSAGRFSRSQFPSVQGPFKFGQSTDLVPPEVPVKRASRWSRGIRAKQKLSERSKNGEESNVLSLVEGEASKTTPPPVNTRLDATGKLDDAEVNIEASERAVEQAIDEWDGFKNDEEGEEEEEDGEKAPDTNGHEQGTVKNIIYGTIETIGNIVTAFKYENIVKAFKKVFGESMMSASPGQSPENHATVAVVPAQAPSA